MNATDIYIGTSGGSVWQRPLSGISGIAETKDQSDGYSIYPNPTNNGKFIIRPPKTQAPVDFLVFDETGRVLHNGKINAQSELDLGRLDAGVYFIKIENNTQKLIIQ